MSFTERDSLGIMITENHNSTAIPECTPSAPVAAIGAVAGLPEYEFFRVGGGTILTDGRVAVANGGTAEIRLYDKSGLFIQSLGRRGNGPGEFNFLGKVWARAGDTLIAHTWHPLRFSVFGPTGEFLRSVLTVPAYSAPQFVSVLADGSTLIATRCCLPGRDGRRVPQQLVIVRHAPDGTVVDTLASFAYGTIGQVGSAADRLIAQPLFQPLPRVDARDSVIVVAIGERPEIVVMGVGGDIVRLIRWTAESVAVTDEHVKIHRAELLTGARTRLDSQSVNVLTGTTRPVSDRFPIASSVHIADSGEIWVEQYRLPPATQTRWITFDTRGRLRCWFVLPHPYRILDTADGLLLGLRTDEFGTEYVELRTSARKY